LVLLIVLIVVERRRMDRGIIMSSNYKRIIITGIVAVLVGIGGTVVFYFTEIPFAIGLPVLGMGIVYIVAGVIYRNEWMKWIKVYSQSQRR
ncbi:unnamed protein product, partial [marine sediment metagenome]